MKKPRILVVGSMVMDLIVRTPRFPNAGETVIGLDFQTAPGGKGANQAVQAARLDADVTLVGRVGDDPFGREMIASVAAAGVRTEHIGVTPGVSSAIGNVQLEVTEGGTANRIVVVPGANDRITQADVDFLADAIGQYDMVLLQLEIPMEINETVAALARGKGVPVMLNPAPFAPVSGTLLANTAYISPNEHEAALMVGYELTDTDTAYRAASDLLEQGANHVIITLGGRGALLAERGAGKIVPAVAGVAVQDPTAAGDSFVAAFCTAVSLGLTPERAMAFANHTAALTVSRMGAQPSLPHWQEVLAEMERRGEDISDLKVHFREDGQK